MPPRKAVLRVLVTAKDRATMLALLRDQRPDIGGTPKVSPDGAVRIDVYVPEDRVEALKRDGVSVQIVGDQSAATRERQKEVGTGNRFETGDPVPRGLGAKIKETRDVS
ncbi:MAG TPA: hypothetical protein VHS78_06180 [Candidatus Elarobacter sp.]|jgi:hypothetical protein|nr:hypothetical protein [Candidatus Elarobacter sp.]